MNEEHGGNVDVLVSVKIANFYDNFLLLKKIRFKHWRVPNKCFIQGSVTSRSREFPFPEFFDFFDGIEIFQNIGVDLGPGLVLFPGFLHFFVWYRNRYRKNFVPKKVSELVSKKMSTEISLGIGLEKFWYRKKSRNRSRKNLVPKKSLGIGIVQILGLVPH